MRILVIGSGGREHALAWKLAKSPLVEQIFIAPGNAGAAETGKSIQIKESDIASLVEFAKKEKIDLVVPGPELPLTLGIIDAMAEAQIPCFGPDKYCACLEGSKSFAKEIMAKAGVPTAKSKAFTDLEAAKKYVLNMPEGLVIKADGLAAGKGVVVANTKQEALDAVEMMLGQRQFGDASAKIVIEEKLEGEEVSLICLCDGETAKPLPSAQDHKAAYDHDQGPNTGGMGAYSPAPVLPDKSLEEITDLVIRPILKTLAEAGHPYKGALYAGLMMTRKGPKVLEYNVRFGDPECQPLLMRLKSDLARHLKACCESLLKDEILEFDSYPALGIVLAADGYPGSYEKDQPIKGIKDAEALEGVKVFYSGVKNVDGQLKSSGGRVLCVTTQGKTLPKAQAKAYAALAKISMPKSRSRKDIGLKGIMRMARGMAS